MSNAVIINNAVKKYGDFIALKGVSLNIKEGEFFTLLGPSGCGKTTLLRMIAGFNSIEGGEFYFGDKLINAVPAHKRDIGMVLPQPEGPSSVKNSPSLMLSDTPLRAMKSPYFLTALLMMTALLIKIPPKYNPVFRAQTGAQRRGLCIGFSFENSRI